MKKLILPVLSATMMLGAAAASAQGLPPYYSQSNDLPWSINRQAPRDLNAYNPGQRQQDQALARQDRVVDGHGSAKSRAAAPITGRSTS